MADKVTTPDLKEDVGKYKECSPPGTSSGSLLSTRGVKTYAFLCTQQMSDHWEWFRMKSDKVTNYKQ